jgi:hypothetical protein
VALNWKIAWLAMGGSVLLLGAGCSGINTTQSISPATFLLPGLLQADPPPTHPDRILPAAAPLTEAAPS